MNIAPSASPIPVSVLRAFRIEVYVQYTGTILNGSLSSPFDQLTSANFIFFNCLLSSLMDTVFILYYPGFELTVLDTTSLDLT